MHACNERKIQELIEENRIAGNLRVCPIDGTGVEELKDYLLKEISWDKARTMIQTITSAGVLRTIVALQENDARVISLEEFVTNYEKETGLHIAKSHLKFLLRDCSNQGLIEYNPEALDLIILNDPEYNRLKTNIPIYVMKKNGIVSIPELRVAFDNSKFLPVIDAMYLKYKVAIENSERRIFPELLREKSVSIPKQFVDILGEISTERRLIRDQKIDLGRFIEALSELQLRCVDVSKRDGLFSWGSSACIYFGFERIGNVLDGFSIRWNYRIGGHREEVCNRLRSDFLNIIEQLYGPFLEPHTPSDKKKLNQIEI